MKALKNASMSDHQIAVLAGVLVIIGASVALAVIGCTWQWLTPAAVIAMLIVTCKVATLVWRDLGDGR